MNYLSVENLKKSYGDRILFENITFGVRKGQKIAMVAKNGAGKSSLFKILAGIEGQDEGTVTFNSSIKTAYLPQEVVLDESKDILANLFLAENDLTKAIKFYEEALESNDTDLINEATLMMDQANAWDYESKAKQILGKLDIHNLKSDIKNLSGGQKKRIGLAKVLIMEPDFLMMDEPTNHLDLDMIEWLEDYFSKTAMTLLMITHDRYFLEVVCNEIIELENQQLYKYTGNFSYFLEKKAEREQQQAANLERTRNLLKRELAWVRTSPKARTTKSKYREDQFHVIKEKASINLDSDELKLQINTTRIGSKIIEFHKVGKSYPGLKLIDNLSYTFKRDEKLGIIGRNGSGKTTLLNMITGKDEPDKGKIVIGETVQFGYYNQKGMKFDEDMKVIDAVRKIADIIPLKGGKKITAEQMLERFLFPRSTQRNLIRKLSGGEKKRLFLLTILMTNPNFLILDEPTNDLDIFTLSVLEEYLMQFPGVLIIVSHDRYFMDKLVDHIFVLGKEGSIKDFPGNYSDWRTWSNKQVKITQPKEKKIAQPKKEKEKTKLSFNEKFEFENIEKDLPLLENKKSKLEEQLNSGEILDHEELSKLAKELGEIISEIDLKTDRWIELSEYL